MTPYDYAVLAIYFGFMLAISWVFRRFVTNISEYFRGGGRALWWMVGGSAFMAAFSAWTFTGAASKAYTDGWPIMAIFVANVAGFALNGLYFAPRFRQLRVITAVEAIRLRFDRPTEQIYTWLQIPLGTLQGGVWLNALGVFFAAAFGFDVSSTILVTGLVVLLMTLLGGSWAVLASDFIQVLILMPVCLVVALLTLVRLGGLHGFAAKLPATHLDFSQIFSKDLLGLWCVAMLLKQLTSTNNLFEAGRYLAAKDSRHARLAGWLGAALFTVGLLTWFIPPMAARVLFPALADRFPLLGNPAEASFIAMAHEVMPVGMMGLLVSGIFAATMSGMDSGLNRNAGIFVRNFYQPYVARHATDKHHLRVGRIATVVFGLLVVYVAFQLSHLEGLDLFQKMQRVSILIATPIALPLLLGLVIKQTPPWAAWSTVLVTFLASVFLGDLLPPTVAAGILGVTSPLAGATREYWTQSVQLFGNVVIGSTWFVGMKLWWSRCSPAYRQQLADFFTTFNTPVNFEAEEGADLANDANQETIIGRLSLAYGVFVMALAAIPNSPGGRLAFVGCGAMSAAVGGALLVAARRHTVRSARMKLAQPSPSLASVP